MLRLLRRFLRPYLAKSVFGVVCKTVEVVLEVLTPLVVARMIDEGVRNHDVGQVVRLGMLLMVFAVVSYAFTFVCQKLASQVSQGLGTDVRAGLYHQINRFSAPELDRFGTASLVTRVTNDVNLVQLAVAMIIRMLSRWPILAVGSVIAALSIDLELGLVFLVCTPAIALAFYFVMSRSIPYYRTMQERLDAVSLVVREALSGMRVIRAFRQEDAEERRFELASQAQTDTAVGVGRLSALLAPVTFLVLNLGVIAILRVGARRIQAGELTQGEVMAFISYMTQTLVSVTYMANLVVIMLRGQASSVRIMEVIDCEPTITDGSSALLALPTPTDAEAPALVASLASFAYGGSAIDAVSDLTLTLGQGQTLGIIGGTGSGKSTLANLVTRLYDTTGGTLEILGHNVRDYRLDQLHQIVSIVPQQATLVSGTIRSNLTWRDADATDDELWEALRRAQAESFVRAKPQGLDEPVEAGGRNYSGGQRQRLCIARALVGSPRLLILDDASSALDFATDASLRKALGELSGTLTTVVVSQRVSAVMGADQILVLDHGRTAGLGTHKSLLESCPIYQEICASQLKREEVSRG